MQRLEVFQSLWAMERRAPGLPEPALTDSIARIRAAGFDGVSSHYTDRAGVAGLARALWDRTAGPPARGTGHPPQRRQFASCIR